MDNISNGKDELDLRIIYYKIKSLLLNLWGFLFYILLIVKKRWILLLTFCMLGAGLGVTLFFTSKPIYISTLTLTSSTLNNDFCSELINELQLFIEDDTPELLAKKLKIGMGTAKEIRKIEFDNFNEKLNKKYKEEDTVVLGLPFKIKVFALNNSIFDTLQTAFVNYLENNDYALKRKEIRKQNIQLLRKKLNDQIIELDSLKNVVATNLLPRGNISGFVFGQPLDPINVYKEAIALFQNDLDLNTQYILIDNIQIINPFSIRNKPASPRLVKSITTGAIAGFLLGMLTAFILAARRRTGSNI